jgi:hypothetical protein
VGIWNENRPVPEDLKKKRFVGGEVIDLADGGRWAIPVCHSVVRGSTLPKRMVLGDDGRTWELRELPEFLTLCVRAEKVWEAFANPTVEEDGRTSIELDHQTAADIAVEALSVNYRVGAAEVSMLGLLDTDCLYLVMMAVVDGFTVQRVGQDSEKKSDTPGT